MAIVAFLAFWIPAGLLMGGYLMIRRIAHAAQSRRERRYLRERLRMTY